ncbi:MAG: potassium-transporting ATPase subunit KdpC [Anaerolineae bacterium]
MRMKEFRPALVMFISLTLITGVIYPLFVTLIAQIVFPAQANGSLVTVDNQVVGSSLIGQMTDDPRYFWSRPSAVSYMQGASLDAPVSSGATNYSSTNANLDALVVEREQAFRSANHVPDDVAVPVEMLFASGSGLDPHISPEAARLQIDRVAEARGLDRAVVATLVEQFVEQPQLGFLGQPRVNVLLLNLALDGLE